MAVRNTSYYIWLISALLFIISACTLSDAEHKEDVPKDSEISLPAEMPSDAETLSMDLLVLNQNKGIMLHRGSPFTGIAVEYYKPEQLKTRIHYIQGKREGRYNKWFSDGTLSYEATYVAGRREGPAQSWWSNGNIRSSSNYQRGIAEGEQLQWYKSGARFKKMTVLNGREEGLQQSWRENGKIYNNYEAKNGRIFGLKRAALCFQLEDEEISYADL